MLNDMTEIGGALLSPGEQAAAPKPKSAAASRRTRPLAPRARLQAFRLRSTWLEDAAGLNFSVQAYTKSVNRLKWMRDLEGAEIYMGHDQDQYAKGGGRWYR